MDAADHPAAAAAEAARRAGERAAVAHDWHRALARRRAGAGSLGHDRGAADSYPAPEQARERARAARVRVRAALLRSALAHDRAAGQHERAALPGGPGAAVHLEKAEGHRSAAVADRIRAAALEAPDDPATGRPSHDVPPPEHPPGARPPGG
ncbi:hypothetical protein AB0F15_18105 [Amycolatopsis sp. NPDC026612]|uniref:hypothetical protein n=1 Tax=Amycolatopsis sp. NPDC026612 TaxID=3155466 RepID=UPI0033CAC0C0